MRPAPDSAPDAPRAQVTLEVKTDTRPIYLTRIVTRRPRPGWHTLDLPPPDRWEEPLPWLTLAQHDRFESPEFYRLLEAQLSRHFEALLRSDE